MKEIFFEAIKSKKIVKIRINSKDKGVIERICIPFDFGESRRYKDGLVRFHFYDLDSPEGKHNLSILPEQLLHIQITDKDFDPGDYVKWEPNWIYPRNWGSYS